MNKLRSLRAAKEMNYRINCIDFTDDNGPFANEGGNCFLRCLGTVIEMTGKNMSCR